MNCILKKISFKVDYPWNTDAETTEVDANNVRRVLRSHIHVHVVNVFIHLQNILSNKSSLIQGKFIVIYS